MNASIALASLSLAAQVAAQGAHSDPVVSAENTTGADRDALLPKPVAITPVPSFDFETPGLVSSEQDDDSNRSMPADYGLIQGYESFLVEQFAEPASSSDQFVSAKLNESEFDHANSVASMDRAALIDIRPRTIAVDDRSIVPSQSLPNDVSRLPPWSTFPSAVNLYASDLEARDFWRGASVCYRPLYFEDRCLERYGSITGVLRHAPVVRAGLHFTWSGLTLPLSVVHYPPCRHVRAGAPSRWEDASKIAPATKNTIAKIAAPLSRFR